MTGKSDNSTTFYVVGQDDDVLDGFAHRTVENSAAYLLSSLQPSFRVLDVGCGTGSITRGLARYCAECSVIGVHSSTEVVHRATADTERAGASKQVKFQVADACALPFADGSFDVVHSHQLVQHVPDARAALVEMRRVAKPGGTIAVRVACAQTVISAGLEELAELIEKMASAIAAGGGDPHIAQKLPSMMRNIGFVTVQTSASLISYISKQERKAFAAICRGAMKGGSMTSADKHDEFEHALHELITLEDAFFILPNVEVLCTK